MNNTTENLDDEIIYVSKSELKRDMLEIQNLGEKISQLSLKNIQKMKLSDELYNEIIKLRNFKHEARRRQLQYIGKVLRNIDNFEDIAKQYDLITNPQKVIEKKRNILDTLFNSLNNNLEDEMSKLEKSVPNLDKKRLRQLFRIYRSATEESSAQNKQKILDFLKSYEN
ncbi:hypothetical protein CF386_02300 [Paraphotobacterium marinum]|uniref:Ribosome-associated protein n=1 Tax=Paraphotobacterium marinum TaxID=1755811 RepID=A0A220VC38_9GAMM|nr:ribosome biogenesis factor YjgA [Paraphotobacterium marinum]ASK77957.1 hypothetical protein CF386_02300 [Paraphotobacterium marinum]